MRKIKEKRRDIRFPTECPVKMIFNTRVSYTGYIKDINQKGALIVAKGAFYVGQKLVLDSLDTELKCEKQICKIVRVVTNGVAIKFDKPLTGEFSTPLP